ncbi:MAG: hypothetical protein LBV38_03835 [Alistipes sp.]|jgi:hypothetical protein|nr:hypothetical protein [Alistipes sp.]
MKKTNFFKLLLVGTMAFALGFSSCAKGPSDKEFQDLCEQVNAMETRLTTLEGVLTGGTSMVVDVTSKNDGTIDVTYANPTKTVNVKVAGAGTGELGEITIGADGNWYSKGADTGFKVIPENPRINAETHMWEFPVVKDGKIEWIAGEKAVAAAYAVNNGGAWTLWLPTSDHTGLQEIKLPSASVGLGKIDILGWVEGYDPKGTLSNNTLTPNDTGLGTIVGSDRTNTYIRNLASETFVVYYNWIERFGVDANIASYNGTTPPAAGPNGIEKPYAYDLAGYTSAAEIYTPATAVTTLPAGPGPLKPTSYEWHVNATPAENFGAIDVKRYQVLNTLGAQNKGLIIQAHPSRDMSGVKFVLEDSKGNALPIAFEAPVLVSGLLTRGAATNSALYFLEGANVTDLYETAEGRVNYAKKYTPNALYSLVMPDGVRSEYTPFTFTPTYVKSLENQVAKVGGGEWITQTGNIDASYYVQVGTENFVEFEAVQFFNGEYTTWPTLTALTALADTDRLGGGVAGTDEFINAATHPYDVAAPEANGFSTTKKVFTNSVVDYYMRIGSNPDDTFIATEFGIKFNDNHTSFTITRQPDDLTLASFNMDVYKLGVDGIIYIERVRIHPVRTQLSTTIPLGDYIVEDGFPGLSGDPNEADYLGSKLEVPLDLMFTDLAKIVDTQEANMAMRWQDDEYGAYTYTITNVTIEGESNNAGKGNLNRFMFPNYVEKGVATATTTGTSAITAAGSTPAATAAVAVVNDFGTDVTAQFATIAGATATGIVALDKDKKAIITTNWPVSDIQAHHLWDARSFNIYPNYAYDSNAATAGGNAPSFVIDKLHTITIKFYDKDGSELNEIKVTVTPRLPKLADLFKKEPEYWKGNVLQAYYKTPDNWLSAPYYGVTSTAAGADAVLGTIDDVLTVNTFISSIAAPTSTSTFYNVYNPGGTTALQHTAVSPLDGGYTKVGLRAAEEHRWVDYTNIALKNGNQQIDGVNASSLVAFDVNYANGTAPDGINGGGTGAETTAKTVIEVLNQTNAAAGVYSFANLPKVDPNPYKDILNMAWEVGPYIGYYTYSNAEIAGEDFDMSIMSALAEGRVEGTSAIVDDAAPGNGEYLALKDEHVKLINYNSQPFSVFKVRRGPDNANSYIAFAYTYIHNVVFSRPNGVSVYDIMLPDPSPATTWHQANADGRAMDPGAYVGTTTTYEESYVALRPNNIATTANTKIHVKVYDRFGRTVEGDVAITLNVTGLQ